MGFAWKNAIFLFLVLVVGIVCSLIFGIGGYVNSQMDTQIQSALNQTGGGQGYMHYTQVRGWQAQAKGVFVTLFDFFCAVTVMLMFFSSMTEIHNISSYVLNFFLACLVSVIVIYIGSNALSMITAGAGAYWDATIIPSWLAGNFFFIMQLNVIAGLLSFAYARFFAQQPTGVYVQ